MGKEITFVSWNVNGIRAAEKKGALDWTASRKIDFLCLQEIKAEAEHIPETLMRRFRFHSINSSSQKGQSGVALFTDIRGEADGCETIDLLHEGRINQYRFGKYVLLNVYFPNGQRNEERLAYKLAFYDRFLAHIDTLREQGYGIIFCGDVNTAHKEIDIARPKANEHTSGFLPIERAWMDKLVSHGYIDTFRYVHGEEKDRYSWWSFRARARERNVGWRIDYFFVSEDLADAIVDADILDEITGSDHAPVILTLSLPIE